MRGKPVLKAASLTRLVALALLIGVAPAAHAVELIFSPGAQVVSLGDPVSVDLLVSGLGDGVPPSLGGFDVDISFDPSILVLTGASLIAPLGGSAQFEFNVQVTASGVVVNLFALSFLSPEDLDALQPGEFTLATLTFGTLASGTSSLVIENAILSDAAGGALPIDSAPNGSVTVPEPATSIGVALGLAALGLLRRRLHG